MYTLHERPPWVTYTYILLPKWIIICIVEYMYIHTYLRIDNLDHTEILHVLVNRILIRIPFDYFLALTITTYTFITNYAFFVLESATPHFCAFLQPIIKAM